MPLQWWILGPCERADVRLSVRRHAWFDCRVASLGMFTGQLGELTQSLLVMGDGREDDDAVESLLQSPLVTGD